MESRAPAVVAVVVTTGPGPGLEVTLASLAAQDYEELSLLVIANGEHNNVSERVAAVAPKAFVRTLDENKGFGAACNEAALMVDGAAFFLFCHDDVRLETNVVQMMVESAFRTNAGIVTPKVVQYEDPMVLVHVGQTSDRFGVVQERVDPGEVDHGQQDLERDVFVAPGGVTLVRFDLFTTLRGFDPLIAVLGEDLDLCWRAQVAGARVVVAPSAKVAHRQTIATGERLTSAVGTRRRSRQDLQRRHQLMVVATGWGRVTTLLTLPLLAVMDLFEFLISLVSRDTDRAGAILSSWLWLFNNRKRIRERRRLRGQVQVLSDSELRRLQVGGASRLKRFATTLLREGLDRARGVLPEAENLHESISSGEDSGVGFAAAFSESEEFDEIGESDEISFRRRASRILTSFRAQATAIIAVGVFWLIATRNLAVMPLPLVGRLAPLDSWWSTWRHFFASWSPNGVGTGSPGMPGYGVLGFAGTFVFGRMGILPRLALIFAIPAGSIGIARLLKNRVSNRARVIASIAYLAMPLGLNMISQGRIDVLLFVAAAPFIVRRLFELLAIPSFRDGAYPAPVQFGLQGWRGTEAGQRTVLVMIIALVSAMAPATLIAVLVIFIGVRVARFFESDENSSRVQPWRTLLSILGSVSIFLLPLTINVVFAGRRALETFGLARGTWTAPSFGSLIRGSDGNIGHSWAAWLLPMVGLLSFFVCQGIRRNIASKVAAIATLSLLLASLSLHHWMGPFTPDVDVLLALYMAMIALLVGLGVSALENDLRQTGFGWRQIFAGLLVSMLVISTAPFLLSSASGRFNLPANSVAQSLSSLAPNNSGSYRVLWLGDPTVLPVAGWSVAPGLAAATTMNGLPSGATLFSPPDSSTSDVLLADVKLALEGRTVRLGLLLAKMGVSTIVVMNASSPELAGVQTVPLRPIASTLSSALRMQSDLSLKLKTTSFQVYGNTMFAGLIYATSNGSIPVPVVANIGIPGHLKMPPSTNVQVVAGLAPAGAFALSVNGKTVPRTTAEGWTPKYQVGSVHGNENVEIVLHQFPLNGLLALFTLGLWAIVWLGFGWVHRVEWLFNRRHRRVVVAVSESVENE